MAIESSGKRRFQQSPTSTLRYRNPQNTRITENVTQFIFDHKSQKRVIPDRSPEVLIESTQGGGASGASGAMTMNKSGKSCAYGPARVVELGGSPDEPGRF